MMRRPYNYLYTIENEVLPYKRKRYMLHKIHLQSTICRVYSKKQLHQEV